jgi:hypothetical protein
MSGSPIVATDGTVIGLIAASRGMGGEDDNHRDGESPSISCLPGWVVWRLTGVAKALGKDI